MLSGVFSIVSDFFFSGDFNTPKFFSIHLSRMYKIKLILCVYTLNK